MISQAHMVRAVEELLSSRRIISHTSIDSDPSQSFSFRLPQTPQPHAYPEHTAPAQEPAEEQNQPGVHGSESGEETQDSKAAQTGSCCTDEGLCCLPALAVKACDLALSVDKSFVINLKCACGTQLRFSNKDQ